MKSSRIGFVIWGILLVLLGVIASANWGTVSLDPSSGGQSVDVTGSQVFPVATAFLGLQAAFLFVSLFLQNMLMRLITLILAGFSLWLGSISFLTGNSQITERLGLAIEEATGISGKAHSDLIVGVDIGLLNYVFAGVLVMLSLFLILRAIPRSRVQTKAERADRIENAEQGDYTQLWDEQ